MPSVPSSCHSLLQGPLPLFFRATCPPALQSLLFLVCRDPVPPQHLQETLSPFLEGPLLLSAEPLVPPSAEPCVPPGLQGPLSPSLQTPCPPILQSPRVIPKHAPPALMRTQRQTKNRL